MHRRLSQIPRYPAEKFGFAIISLLCVLWCTQLRKSRGTKHRVPCCFDINSVISKQIWAVNNHHKIGRIREKLILAGGQACYSIQPQFMRKGAFLKKSEIIWNYDILWILQICKLLDGNSEAQKYYVKDLFQFRLRLPTVSWKKRGLNFVLITRPTFIDRAEERFWSKCARPSLIPPVPPAFVSQLGSWGHASASILIITISILPTSSHAWDPTMPFAIFLGYC